MNTEQLRTNFEAWVIERYRNPLRLTYDERRIAWKAYQAGRAALQSQDRADAERYRYLVTKLQQAHDGERFESEGFGVCCRMSNQQNGNRTILAEIAWRDKPDEPIGLSEAIDHARRVEGERNARALD